METWTLADLPGRLAIVTGATGGLGFETALALAGQGADVLIAARDPDKGREAVRRLHEAHPHARIDFDRLDLSDLGSVEDFAARRLADGRPVDILVNNAGLMAPPDRRVSRDGHELQLATNYLGHFALTGRLLPLLSAGRARVMQVSSIAHRGARIHFDDIAFARHYRPWAAYQQSKLAMLMFALELDRRAVANGWPITSVAAHPGFARTALVDNGVGRGGLRGVLFSILERLASHSAHDGARPLVLAAGSPDVRAGDYLGPTGHLEMHGPPGRARIDKAALDQASRDRLWAWSVEATGLTDFR